MRTMEYMVRGVEYATIQEPLIKIGSELWFEYHCWEDEKSADAELWHHSHQKATVIGIAPNDGMEIPTRKEREDCGQPISYKVRFADGFESDACEDELMDSKKIFCRKDPPKKQETAVKPIPPTDKPKLGSEDIIKIEAKRMAR